LSFEQVQKLETKWTWLLHLQNLNTDIGFTFLAYNIFESIHTIQIVVPSLFGHLSLVRTILPAGLACSQMPNCDVSCSSSINSLHWLCMSWLSDSSEEQRAGSSASQSFKFSIVKNVKIS